MLISGFFRKLVLKTGFLSDAIRVEHFLEHLTAVEVVRGDRSASARKVLKATARGPIPITAFDIRNLNNTN